MTDRYSILHRLDDAIRGCTTAAPWAVLVLLLCNTAVPSAMAQSGDLRFEHISTADGLSQGFVYAMLQDSRGFVWFGTRNGLNKYDGYGFTHYKHRPFDSTSLSSDVIRAIAEDARGNLWIATYRGGLVHYMRGSDRFVTLRHDPGNRSSISSDDVASLHIDASGTLWAGTLDGRINRLDDAADMTTTAQPAPRFRRYSAGAAPGEYVHSICSDRDGSVLAGASAAVLRYDRRGDRFQPLYVVPRSNNGTPTKVINLLTVSPRGELWLGMLDGAYRVDRETWTPQLQVPGHNVRALLFDGRRRRILIAVSSGMIEYHRLQGRTAFYRLGTRDRGSLTGDNVISLYSDRSGALWVGTDAGICRAGRAASRFQTGFGPVSAADSVSRMNIRSLCHTRDGHLLLGTAGDGLIDIDHERGVRRQIANGPPGSNPRFVNAIYEDSGGRVWLGTRGGIFHLADGRMRPWTLDHSGIPHLNVWDICLDSRGMLWVATANGLLRVDTTTRQVRRYVHDPADSTTIAFNAAWTVHQDRSGTLWVGTPGGLCRYNRATDDFIRHTHDPADSSSLSHNEVWSIAGGHDGALWLGTWGGGLNRFDRRSGKFEHYMERNGFGNNVVQAIVEDHSGTLWVSTAGGVTRLDPRTGAFYNYTSIDGLQAEEFNPNAVCLTPEGWILFGGTGGLNSFDPANVSAPSSFMPPVVITAFRKAGELVATDLPNATSVEIAPDENFFSFEFAALDYNNPSRIRYEYILEGFDPEWITSGQRRYASYTNLPPGNYIFRVRSTNSDGIWQPSRAALHVSVLPPFWQTPLCMALIMLTAGSMAVGVYFLRLRRVRRRELALDEARENERRQIASELHDGPLQDLYSTRFMLDALSHGNGAAEASIAGMEQTLKRVRASLRNVCGDLQLPSFDCGLDDAIRAHAARLADSHPQLEVRLELMRDDRHIPADVRENLFRIYRTAMNNVIRHAGADHVVVELGYRKGGILLEVRDNGRGFKAPRRTGELLRNNHYGLLLADANARAIGARLELDSSPGKGTTLRVTHGWRGRGRGRG